MKLKLSLPAFILFAMIGAYCSNSRRHDDRQGNSTGNTNPVKTKPASSYNDTLKIRSSSAVFFNPDSLQLEKIKAITDKQIFEGTMHECFYLMRHSRIVLKKEYPGIKIIDVKNVRYLLFKKSNNDDVLIDLDKKNDPCGVFIFDGTHSPQLVDMANIETELGFYFSRQEIK